MLPSLRAAPPALPATRDIQAQKQKLLAEVPGCETELRSKGGREQKGPTPQRGSSATAPLLGDPLSQCLRPMEERLLLGLVCCFFFLPGWKDSWWGNDAPRLRLSFPCTDVFCRPAEGWDVRARLFKCSFRSWLLWGNNRPQPLSAS